MCAALAPPTTGPKTAVLGAPQRSPLRQFKIKAADYGLVHTWIKRQKKIEPSAEEAKEDEKRAEVIEKPDKGHMMPVDYLPKVPWAHKAPLRLQKVEHGKEVIMVQERGVWKRLVHEGLIDGYLRGQLLSSNSDVPMSRDAGYHIVQKRTVGISRRALGKFISKQAVLQITRDQLPVKQNPGRPLYKRGKLELDLVEAKGHDIGKYVHHPVKNFYWITLVDRLTGWLEVRRTVRKDVESVAPKLKQMLRKMSAALKAEITLIRSDSGSEFKADTKTLLEQMGIRHKMVKSGNRIEQCNKTFQKIWYRLMRLGRGDVNELDVQAAAIFNNTLSSVTGKTPLEALEEQDGTLAAAFNADKRRHGVPKYKAVTIKLRDRCRYLIQNVVGKHGFALAYKSYRGKHWSADVHTVVKMKWEKRNGVRVEDTDTYYVGGYWRTRDKLLKVPGVDAITRDLVVRKHRLKKKDWVDKIGNLALP